MVKIRLALFLTTMIVATDVLSQDIPFRRVDVSDGLVDNYVRDITSDKYGFMWFATMNGLCRFDGYAFQTYMLGELPAENDVQNVFETSDTTLWVITGQGIHWLDRRMERVMPADSAFFSRLDIGEGVRMVTSDEHGNLWACANERLYYHDYIRHTTTVFPYYGQSEIITMTSGAGYTVVLARDGRFYMADTATKRLSFLGQTTLHLAPFYQRLYIDRRQRLWLYTAHSAVGRPLCFSLSERRWVDSPLCRQLQDIDITRIHHDASGNLWIATENRGVFITGEDASEELPLLGCSPYGTYSAHINCFHEQGSTMWMGSAKQGVAFADMSCRFFQQVGTSREDITAMAEDSGGRVWIAFDGGGVACRAADGSYTYYNIENHGVSSDIVTAVVLPPDGMPWTGSYGNGVARFNGNRFVRIRPKGLPTDVEAYVKCMVADNDGSCWIGTMNDGVVHLRADGSADWLRAIDTPMRTGSTLSMDIDRRNRRLLIGTSVGLYIYDIQQGRFVTPERLDSLLGGEYVTAVRTGDGGRIVAGSRRGLWIYDWATGASSHLTTANGMSNDYVRSIAEDCYHCLWVGTDNGLTRVTKLSAHDGKGKGYRCQGFYEDDGLGGTLFFNNAACTLSDSTCLLGSFHGYLRIFPTDCDPRGDGLRVMFTSLSVNGQTIAPSDPRGMLPMSLPMAREIRIDYDDTNIELSVSAMTMTRQSSIAYYYRMDGEEKWQHALTNVIAFHQLPPGTHTLQVRAASSDGRSSEIATLRIVVAPHFLASRPALLFYAALSLMLLWLVFRFFQRRQRKRIKAEQDQMKRLQQYEMEEKKIKFFTNISHDLKTPLSLVIAPLDKVLSTSIPNSLRIELETAWHNARVLYNEVNQLLDFRRIDMGSDQLHLSHGNPFDITRDVVHGFEYTAGIHDIKTTLRVNGPEFEMDFDENKLRRIIGNLLQNAYKYNHPGGRVGIVIGGEERDGKQMLVISVADTGRGISDTDKPRIFERFYQVESTGEYIGTGIGLHIVKEHVEMHGGTITVDDNHPEGTVFTVSIPAVNGICGDRDPDESKGLVSDAIQNHASCSRDSDRMTILVVEDNIEARHFLERSLANEYTILSASQGREAIGILRHGNVGMVISDVMMPVMNGLELCNYIKGHLDYSHIPVILLTAKSTDSDILSGLNEGADDYIAKPYNLNILRMRIRKILEWKEAAQQQFAKGISIEPSEITVSSTDQELITKAIQIVEEHMRDESFSVSELSAALGMTRGNLYKKLMSITGKTPVQFIRILRIKRGKDLIDQGRTYISEVAQTVGYSSALFSRYFREAYGCLPSDYIRDRG